MSSTALNRQWSRAHATRSRLKYHPHFKRNVCSFIKKTYRLLSCYSDSSYYMAPSQFRFIIRSLIHHATAIWPPITLARVLTCPRSSDQRSPNRIAVYHDTTLHLSSKSVIIIRRHRLTQSVKTRTNEDRSRTACPGNSFVWDSEHGGRTSLAVPVEFNRGLVGGRDWSTGRTKCKSNIVYGVIFIVECNKTARQSAVMTSAHSMRRAAPHDVASVCGRDFVTLDRAGCCERWTLEGEVCCSCIRHWSGPYEVHDWRKL